MNKRDFIERLAKKEYTIKDATIIVEDFLDTLEEIMVEGESVTFHGFGTFGTIERKERKSTCVNSGDTILIPAFRSPKFEAGKSLKRSVRDGLIRK